MSTPKTRPDTRSTVAKFSIVFSTHFMRRGSRLWSKLDSCPRRSLRIPSPTGIAFLIPASRKSTPGGRIRRKITTSGLMWFFTLSIMPEALSTHPEPYRHSFPNTSVQEIYTGWAYPPKDYDKWADVVFHFVDHLRQRYGD